MVEITADKLDIRRKEKANLRIINEGTLTVGLDTEITPELSKEGDVRDLIRGVQNMRKEAGLAVTDRIRLFLSGSDRLKTAWEHFAGLVSSETLAVETSWGNAAGAQAVEAGDETWMARIEKV